MKVPEFLLNMAMQRVREEIKQRAHFDIEDHHPLDHARAARIPALFAVARDDDFVLPHHTFDLHKAWGSADRKLVTVCGGHDSRRPLKFMKYAAEFLQSRLAKAAASRAAAF